MKNVDEIRRLRLKLKLSMSEVCKLTDTPYRTWQNWELGKSRVPGVVLFCLKMWIENKEKVEKLKLDISVAIDKLK